MICLADVSRFAAQKNKVHTDLVVHDPSTSKSYGAFLVTLGAPSRHCCLLRRRVAVLPVIQMTCWHLELLLVTRGCYGRASHVLTVVKCFRCSEHQGTLSLGETEGFDKLCDQRKRALCRIEITMRGPR